MENKRPFDDTFEHSISSMPPTKRLKFGSGEWRNQMYKNDEPTQTERSHLSERPPTIPLTSSDQKPPESAPLKTYSLPLRKRHLIEQQEFKPPLETNTITDSYSDVQYTQEHPGN